VSPAYSRLDPRHLERLRSMARVRQSQQPTVEAR
jgi:hypothetical protein